MSPALPVERYQGHGLLSKLFDDCKRYNSLSDDVALACACQVISAVTQRRYRFHYGSSALYHIIVVPMGGGKEGYRRWIETYLRAVNSDLTGVVYRSDQALKLGLSEHPSRVLLIDEIADNLSGAYDKRAPDPMMQDLITIWNELYNAVPLMAGSRTKKDKIEAIIRPRLGICGFTTPGMFSKLMGMREFTETGLLSRFQLHVIEGHHYDAWDDERLVEVRPDPALLQELKSLANGGFAMEPDDDAIVDVEVDKAAMRLLKQYADTCKHDALVGVEANHRGMHRRIRELTARKMAGLRALALGRRAIMPGDVRWGMQAGDEAWKRTQIALGAFGGSEEAQDQAKLLATITAMWEKAGRVPIYVSVVKGWKKYRDMDGHLFNRAVQGLVLTGQVELVGPSKKHVQPAILAEQPSTAADFYGDTAPEVTGLTN